VTLLPLGAASAPGLPRILTFSEDDMNAPGKSWTMVQDRDGTLIFGRVGITTFDGDRWRTWPMHGAFGVRALDLAPDGRLWAGGAGQIGFFTKDALNAWTFHSLVHHIPTEERDLAELWYAFATPHGAIFIANRTVYEWTGSRMRVWKMPGERRLSGFRHGGQIYVQQMSAGVHRMTDAGPTLDMAAENVGGGRILWTSHDRALILTDVGWFERNGDRYVERSGETNVIIRQANPSWHPVDLGSGRLVLPTVRRGLLFLSPDGTIDRTVSVPEGLPSASMNTIFLDRDRQMWGTTSTHVFRLSADDTATVFDTRSNVPATPVLRAVEFRGHVYAGTESEILRLAEDGRRFTPYVRSENPLSYFSVSTERLIASGYLAAFEFDGLSPAPTGLNLVDQQTFAVIPARERPGVYYVGESNRVVRVTSQGQREILAQRLPPNPTSLAEDWRGRLWFGSGGGQVHSVDPSAPSITPPALPAHVAPTIVTASGEGTVFAASASGAWVLQREVGAFAAVRGFPHRTVRSLSAHAQNDECWVVFEATKDQPPLVGRIALHGGAPHWEPHEINDLPVVGQPRGIFAAKAEESKRVLWLSGTKGVLRTVLTPGVYNPPPRAPLVTATAIIPGTDERQPLSASLPYNTRSIHFSFAAPEFSRREQLRIESFVEGVDHNWMPAGRDSTRELTAVREGDYRLKVRAVSPTGATSSTTELAFRVLPPWWRTTPAIVGLVAALLPAGIGLYRLRIRALRRRNLELEEKVRQRTEELEAANAAKTEFVANMSHDIRNPLNGIVGLALALEDTRLDSRQRDLVATLRECTSYLSTLVDDVLDFASIEAGKIELRPGPFAPEELLRSIVSTLKGDTAESGATIFVDTDPTLPPHLLGDAGRIQQILVNFISNALKYAGGEIRLSATCPRDRTGEVEFSVRDFGPGISLSDQATLFTKFTRLKRSDKVDIPGAGLGLAACRLLADFMGGAVGVESTPGNGARFYLRLPLTMAESLDNAPADLPNATVLLVEDTDYNAVAATAVLARLGLSCDRACTGEEALRLFGEKRYNIVLLDRNLPDMDGTEVAQRIRDLETEGRQALLLAVTAYATAEDRELCLRSGMDAFVGKPLTPEKLKRVLVAAGRKLLAAPTVDVQSEPPAAADQLDLSLLRYLSNGTEDGFSEQVERFLATLEAVETRVGEALRQDDFANATLEAHRLVGQARMVGAHTLAAKALELEQAAKAHDRTTAEDKLAQASFEADALRAAMRRPQRSTTAG
jgi:signal transduction histidine kinase/CheY-like chemotaxis protein